MKSGAKVLSSFETGLTTTNKSFAEICGNSLVTYTYEQTLAREAKIKQEIVQKFNKMKSQLADLGCGN